MESNAANLRYVLHIRDLDINPEVVITEAEYLEIAKQRLILIAAIGLEETYDLLVGNFVEYEKELLDIAADYLVGSSIIDHGSLFRLRHRASQRVVNLLTAARLYVDQLPRRFRNCNPNVIDPSSIVKPLLSTQYDNRFGYRFMEALRNYAQHEGLPVHALQVGSQRKSIDSGMAHYVHIFSHRSRLVGTEFKKSILQEMPEIVDLKRAVRSYVSGISVVHRAIRSEIRSSVEAACAKLSEVHDSYPGGRTENKTGLAASIFAGDDEREYVPVVRDWEKTWRSLSEEGRDMSHSDKKHVTSETLPETQSQAPDTSLLRAD